MKLSKVIYTSGSYDAMQCDYCGDYYDPRDMTEYDFDDVKWYSCPYCETKRHGIIEVEPE
jgi:NAD-dependent SIR2 family protein deacetylase